MARYEIITVVDITRTNPARDETDRVKLGQQANFNCLVQAIGMRSNVTWVLDPESHTGRLPIGQGKATIGSGSLMQSVKTCFWLKAIR